MISPPGYVVVYSLEYLFLSIPIEQRSTN